jgi:hypothetical protein
MAGKKVKINKNHFLMKRLMFLAVLKIFIGLNSVTTGQNNSTPEVSEVIVVFKTHFDIGYTDWADNVRYSYANQMVEGALEIIDQSKQMPAHQQFNWIVAGWPMREMLNNSKPDVKPRIEEALRKGNFTVHALPFTFETEACELESMVRSLSYSSQINREAGLPLPIDAKQTDVPSHSWALPTILNNAGIKFLHIGCNPASPSPEVPLLFWWEGPDGLRLMTMYFGPYYGTTPAPPDGWPYKTWLAIIHTNDNTGAPSYEEFVNAIKEIENKNPGAKVRSGSMADFYNALMTENPDLPVIRGDMPDTWIHGYMSMPREVKSARKIATDIINLESLQTHLTLWGGQQDNTLVKLIQNAMEKIHLFNEHTFGLAMSHGHGGYWAYNNDFEALRAQGFYDPIEFSWNEKALHIKNAEQIMMPAYSRKMKELAMSVNTTGGRIVVYNPTPWERSGVVTVQTLGNMGKALRNTATGELIRFAQDKNIIRFITGKIPPMGYVTFIPVEEEPTGIAGQLSVDDKNYTLENSFFKITLDPASGTIQSLTDKNSGKEMVAADSEWKFGQYVTERYSKTETDQYAHDYIKSADHWHWAYAELGRINLSDDPYKRISGSEPDIRFTCDEISASAEIHFEPKEKHGHKYTVIITLYRNSPYVELIWSINGKPAEPWPEAGWITFPFNISQPVFKLGRPGAVVNPATDFIKGTNMDYYFLTTGMAVTEETGHGFGITSPDVPGISLDRPGLWKYTPGFVPQKPNVFFNLYNNQWSTNFTEWIEGSWSARFYLWAFDSYDNEHSIITPSEEFRNPLVATYVSGQPGPLPLTGEGIKLSVKGVKITAFGPNPDGEGTLLRIWEQAGNSGTLELALPHGLNYSSAQPVNLRGEKAGEEFAIKSGNIIFKLNAYSPASFILK